MSGGAGACGPTGPVFEWNIPAFARGCPDLNNFAPRIGKLPGDPHKQMWCGRATEYLQPGQYGTLIPNFAFPTDRSRTLRQTTTDVFTGLPFGAGRPDFALTGFPVPVSTG